MSINIGHIIACLIGIVLGVIVQYYNPGIMGGLKSAAHWVQTYRETHADEAYRARHAIETPSPTPVY